MRRRRSLAGRWQTGMAGLLLTLVALHWPVPAEPAQSAPQATTSTPETTDNQPPEPPVVSIRLQIKPLPDDVRRISLQRSDQGDRWFTAELTDGTVRRLESNELAVLLDPGEVVDNAVFRLLNITSPIGILWVLLGLTGQVLFTGRMILQWLVSEREKRSVVPVGFWWMSLSGASMLMLYFVWRKDIVGVLGQSTGWFIYARNLWLIYRERMRS